MKVKRGGRRPPSEDLNINETSRNRPKETQVMPCGLGFGGICRIVGAFGHENVTYVEPFKSVA